MEREATPAPAAQVLFGSLVDYAGTFPPAALDLATAMGNYARARTGPHSWLLGRFVIAANRLPDFEATAAALHIWPADAPSAAGQPWPLSLILDPAAPDPIDRFNEKWHGRARIVAVECPPLTDDQLDQIAVPLAQRIDTFVEVPMDHDCPLRVAAVAGRGASVKLRTGGVTAGAIAPAPALVQALIACARTGVAFKATAGLHHAVRGRHPLTADPDGPAAEMHGFLNVTVSAVLAHLGEPPAHVADALGETSIAAFGLGPEGLVWRDRVMTRAELADARRRGFRSFGSCSFDEPVQDLVTAGIIA